MERFGFHPGFFAAQLVNLLCLFLVAAVIITVLFRLVRRSSSPATKESAPLDVLKQRLAKGEINEQEYQRLKALIEDKDTMV
jgi:putative membrane protein